MAGNASRLKMGHYPLPEAEARKMAAEEEDTLEAAMIRGRHHLNGLGAALLRASLLSGIVQLRGAPGARPKNCSKRDQINLAQ